MPPLLLANQGIILSPSSEPARFSSLTMGLLKFRHSAAMAACCNDIVIIVIVSIELNARAYCH